DSAARSSPARRTPSTPSVQAHGRRPVGRPALLQGRLELHPASPDVPPRPNLPFPRLRGLEHTRLPMRPRVVRPVERDFRGVLPPRAVNEVRLRPQTGRAPAVAEAHAYGRGALAREVGRAVAEALRPEI